jgi:hypothetical protein
MQPTVAPFARTARFPPVVSIRQIDATEVFPNLWQGGLHQFAGLAAPTHSLRPTLVSFSDLDRAVVLAPDVGVIIVSPAAKVLPLDDSGDARSDMSRINEASSAADRVAAHLVAGRRVGVFCRAGRNRSGLVAALAIRRLAGWTGAQAMQHVKSTRPFALTNEHFARFLNSLGAPQHRVNPAT